MSNMYPSVTDWLPQIFFPGRFDAPPLVCFGQLLPFCLRPKSSYSYPSLYPYTTSFIAILSNRSLQFPWYGIPLACHPTPIPETTQTASSALPRALLYLHCRTQCELTAEQPEQKKSPRITYNTRKIRHFMTKRSAAYSACFGSSRASPQIVTSEIRGWKVCFDILLRGL